MSGPLVKFLILQVIGPAVAFHTNEVLKDFEGRIIGGLLTAIEEIPYQVSLRRNGNHVCGGSIYQSNIIITAAHCVQDEDAEDFTVVAGTSLRKMGGVERFVKNITYHPDFSFSNFDYDVAVLLLEGDFSYDESIQSIAMIDSEAVFRTGTSATVSGWGYLQEHGSLAEVLQCVKVNLMSKEECSIIFPGMITDRMICASALDQDACDGDSGGPLVIDGKLAGIVSWGHGCARAEYPGVYANIAILKDWIEESIFKLLDR